MRSRRSTVERVSLWLVALWLVRGAHTTTSAKRSSSSRSATRPGASKPSSLLKSTRGRMSPPEETLGEGAEQLEERRDSPSDPGAALQARHRESDGAKHRRVGIPPEL